MMHPFKEKNYIYQRTNHIIAIMVTVVAFFIFKFVYVDPKYIVSNLCVFFLSLENWNHGNEGSNAGKGILNISPKRHKSILHRPADVLNFIDLIKEMLKITTKCPLSTKTTAQFP